MNRRCRELLSDLLDAAEFILGLVEGDDWSFAMADRLRRNAIERNFEILGITLSRLEREDERVAAMIEERRDIIGFRNRIAHGYDHDFDAAIFDDVIRGHLPTLRAQVARLLDDG